jgi:LacI family transcriptional regulator
VVDDLESASNATEHLIKTGCKRIALFSAIDNLSVGKLRAKGYFKALENNGIKVDEKLILCAGSEEEFDGKLISFFENNSIDGVFGLDEHSSVMAMKYGIKNNYKIPENLSVIGFADGVWSRRMTPSLSTVSQHGPEIGEVAAKMLIAKLESKEEIYQHKTTVINTELRQRESTKKLV